MIEMLMTVDYCWIISELSNFFPLHLLCTTLVYLRSKKTITISMTVKMTNVT